MAYEYWALGLAAVSVLGMVSSAAPAATGVFAPGEVWPDTAGVHINAHGGGLLLHKGVYYWFGEHKDPAAEIAGTDIHTPQCKVGVRVYSSKDLHHWKNEGVALAVSSDPSSPIHIGCIIERPKVIYNAKTRKFVMWFHLELNNEQYPKYSAAFAGVAVADQPQGPYRFVGGGRHGANTLPVRLDPHGRLVTDEVPHTPENRPFLADFEKGQMARDMTLYQEEDGRAYIVTTSEDNHLMHIIALSDDYLSQTGTYARFNSDFRVDARGDSQNEAPTVFKRNGKYYLICSGTTGWDPNPARSFVADSIWGPWKYLGNPCRGTPEQNAITFDSQPTYVLPVPGHPGEFIYMADRWRPNDPIDGRYIWLPIEWETNQDGLEIPVLRWHDRWSIDEHWRRQSPART